MNHSDLKWLYISVLVLGFYSIVDSCTTHDIQKRITALEQHQHQHQTAATLKKATALQETAFSDEIKP